MASKRFSRSTNEIIKVENYNSLKINEVLCPICRSIFVEPVTLPCNHGFCYSCFEGTMQNANLVCPLCRIRIGSWLRKTKKEGKLINNELWKAVKQNFGQHVKNKLMGIDENFEEEPEIIVSFPGEIRREYEIQKQKQDEELRIKREADIKASEELIQKIKEEEEYQKTVIEEKLKFDEQIAKKLAEELSSPAPSTSKDKANDKLGPIYKYFKKDSESLPSQNVNNKKPINFSTKEYTCRVLCLDNNDNKKTKAVSTSVKKKIQQIQKFVDLDATSDGSDCIESEMRYFKPIDHRLNPPSQGKSPIKVPIKKALQDVNAIILSPSGMTNFHSNILESAFARITVEPSKTSLDPILRKSIKRSCPSEDITSPSKRRAINKEDEKESPILNKMSLKKDFQQFENASPPFFGFENTKNKSSKIKPIIGKINGICKTSEELSKKLLQEQADLEFAKKLQEEFNRTAYKRSTRRTTIVTSRQTTLDEIIRPYQVK